MELIKTVITNPYFKAVFVFAVFLTGARLTYLLITYIAAKWAKKTPTQLDDLILSRIKSPVSYLILLAGVSIGFNFLPLPDSVKIILSKIIASIILIISCYLATFSTIKLNEVSYLKRPIGNKKYSPKYVCQSSLQS